jgi:hypothetical protein
MNMILDINNFQIENIYFLEKKDNIVFDGIFTKLLYSNNCFIMNGIYFQLPIEFIKISEVNNKTVINYQIMNKLNLLNIQEITNLENKIIDYYKKMYNCNKNFVNNLSKHISSGIIKIYNNHEKSNFYIKNTFYFIIKISGVWETHNEVGVTYKIYKN